jgi:hypothetical protein
MSEKAPRIKTDLELRTGINIDKTIYSSKADENHKTTSSLTFKGTTMEMGFVLTVTMDPMKVQAFKELTGLRGKHLFITISLNPCEQKKITDFKDQDTMESEEPQEEASEAER